MHFHSITLLLCSLLVSAVYCHPLTSRQDRTGDALLRKIYQFPNGTWVENLAVRSNGKILVTLISAPEIWEVNPFATPEPTAELIYSFPEAISLLGIVEYEPDVFAVNVGNWSDKTFSFETGSWSVWNLDMNVHPNHWPPHHGVDAPRHNSHQAYKISDIPPAKFLNGLTSLPANPTTLLVGDAGEGLVYSLDTSTRVYKVAIDDPSMKPNGSIPVTLGVNGVQFRPGEDGYVYFTTTFSTPAFARVPIDALTGAQVGPVETIVASVADFKGNPDDFTFDPAGDAAYIANGASDGLLKISGNLNGDGDATEQVVVGGSDQGQLIGPTACHFGRTEEDVRKGTLYITTTGGIAAPPPRGVVGGTVFALDTVDL